MSQRTRRRFLVDSALVTSALLLPRKSAALTPGRLRRGRLRVGVIGVDNRGAANLGQLAKEDVDIVALCDVDRRSLEKASKKFAGAKAYADFRQLLAEVREIDAVMVSTPDHTHAPASAMALRRGLDVYCEKPLTHTVHEARVLAALAREQGAVTQMGIQIHALPNYRRVVELVQSGAIGAVREVHVACTTNWSGGELPTEQPAIPEWLSWDLWLGPAAERAYHPIYVPAKWRRWWEFGSGTLGDMACHYMDLVFWALDLRYPTTVGADGPIPHPETAPQGLRVSYEFPARGDQPPVALTWNDAGRRPPIFEELGLEKWKNGVLFVGDKGWVVGDYNKLEIGPAADFAESEPPQRSIPDSVGHYKEWVEACQSRAMPSCNFDYAGPLTETVLLGNIAFRLGKKLEWDAERGVVRNAPEAAKLLRREYRSGWDL